MTKYKVTPLSFDDNNSLIEKVKDEVIQEITPHLKEEFKNANIWQDLKQEIVQAAEYTIGCNRDYGPDRKEWQNNLLKQLNILLPIIKEIKNQDLWILDAELRSNEKFRNYCANSTEDPRYTILFNQNTSDKDTKNYIELTRLKDASLFYLREFKSLLEKSLKGKKPGERRNNDSLVSYCNQLSIIFEKYTTKKLAQNGPFERFFNICLIPYSAKYGYSENSTNGAIRKLQLYKNRK